MRTHLDTQGTRTQASWSVWLVIVLTLAAAACASSTSSPETEQTVQSSAASSTEGEVTSNGAGAYISLADYQASKDAYAESKVVLFFNATWCSTCKKARSNLEADLSAIPADLAIVLVDFDSETDLKRQYGVTVQHTFVQIDTDGNQLAKWSGSLTAQEIVENAV